MDFLEKIKKESHHHLNIGFIKPWFISDDDFQPDTRRKEKTRNRKFGFYQSNSSKNESEEDGFREEWSIDSDLWF